MKPHSLRNYRGRPPYPAVEDMWNMSPNKSAMDWCSNIDKRFEDNVKDKRFIKDLKHRSFSNKEGDGG